MPKQCFVIPQNCPNINVIYEKDGVKYGTVIPRPYDSDELITVILATIILLDMGIKNHKIILSVTVKRKAKKNEYR